MRAGSSSSLSRADGEPAAARGEAAGECEPEASGSAGDQHILTGQIAFLRSPVHLSRHHADRGAGCDER